MLSTSTLEKEKVINCINAIALYKSKKNLTDLDLAKIKSFDGASILKNTQILTEVDSPSWIAEARKKIFQILSQEEIDTLTKSSLFNSHYTQEYVVEIIWDYLLSNKLDLVSRKELKIIDPGCGTSGLLWKMGDRNIERLPPINYLGLDTCAIASGMAKIILKNDSRFNLDHHVLSVHNRDFIEYSKRFVLKILHGKESGFDLVISNFPFTSPKKFKSNAIDGYEQSIHAAFLEYSVKILNPQGILCCITSTSFLDSSGKIARQFRKWVAERCLLIGALRLPRNMIFCDRTEVSADLILLQKKIK